MLKSRSASKFFGGQKVHQRKMKRDEIYNNNKKIQLEMTNEVFKCTF